MKEIDHLLQFLKDQDHIRPVRPTTNVRAPQDCILMCISKDEQASIYPALLEINDTASFISTLPSVSADELVNAIHREGISGLLISHTRWLAVSSLLHQRSALLKNVSIIVLPPQQALEKGFALIPKEAYVMRNASLTTGDRAFRKIAQQVYENHSDEKLTPWGMNKDRIHGLFYTHVRLGMKASNAFTFAPQSTENMVEDC